MKFLQEKFTALIMKIEKRQRKKGIEVPNKKIRTLEKRIITCTWEYWKWTQGHERINKK